MSEPWDVERRFDPNSTATGATWWPPAGSPTPDLRRPGCRFIRWLAGEYDSAQQRPART